jgi:hypothetical protein
VFKALKSEGDANKRFFPIILIATMFAAMFVDYLLKPVIPLWLRAPAVGLFVAVVILLASLLVNRKNKQGS